MKDFRWSRDGRTLLRDGALALAFALGTCLPILAAPDSDFVMRALPPSLLMCASLALRRTAPLVALGVLTLAGGWMTLMISSPVPALLAVPVVVYR